MGRRRRACGLPMAPRTTPHHPPPRPTARVLQALLDGQLAAAGAGGAWREPHLLVLQPLLDARADCVAPRLAGVVTALAAAADGSGVADSPKLAQAMMALAAGFGAGLDGRQLAALTDAAARTRSFLAKGLMAKLRALAPA